MNGETHYIPAFTAINGRDQQAVCGLWVRADEHTTEPTCADCRAYLTDEGQTSHLAAAAEEGRHDADPR